MTEPQDPLKDLARELRQGVGAELRAEAEITEQETHQGRLRKRTLSDVARQAANRGDQVTVPVAHRTFIGTVIHVGNDYLTLETAGEWVEIRLDAAPLRIRPHRSGGLSTTKGSATFKARLGEYEQTGERIELIIDGGEVLPGTVTVVAVDHIMFEETSGETVVPLTRILAVARRRHL